jgi:hypothetical protein
MIASALENQAEDRSFHFTARSSPSRHDSVKFHRAVLACDRGPQPEAAKGARASRRFFDSHPIEAMRAVIAIAVMRLIAFALTIASCFVWAKFLTLTNELRY